MMVKVIPTGQQMVNRGRLGSRRVTLSRTIPIQTSLENFCGIGSLFIGGSPRIQTTVSARLLMPIRSRPNSSNLRMTTLPCQRQKCFLKLPRRFLDLMVLVRRNMGVTVSRLQNVVGVCAASSRLSTPAT